MILATPLPQVPLPLRAAQPQPSFPMMREAAPEMMGAELEGGGKGEGGAQLQPPAQNLMPAPNVNLAVPLPAANMLTQLPI